MSAASLVIIWDDRLDLPTYKRSACLAALQGKEIPYALGHSLSRLCVMRGIRYHHGFGLELRGLSMILTRSLNARDIMRNIIPNDLDSQDYIPYCIWHLEVATQDTCRQLVRHYPYMAYQVGRACAVAGYTQLYHELGILSNVHIAEEARECSSLDICYAFMSQPVRYDVINDCERRLEMEDPQPAHFNGDMVVYWMLDVKQIQDASSGF